MMRLSSLVALLLLLGQPQGSLAFQASSSAPSEVQQAWTKKAKKIPPLGAISPELVTKRGRGVHGGMSNPPTIPMDHLLDSSRPTVKNCTENFFKQKMDHFGFAPLPEGVPTHYMQRYYTCLTENWQPGSPIFYYTGNEVDVSLFVESTGLMWQNAPKFGAMLIFAEHRYFGKSLPFPNETMPEPSKLEWLTTDQALADYATHINWFKESNNANNSQVVGFGGSYGGMLCSWLRIKYPSALDVCIAGSAPIANFEDLDPPYNSESFAAQVSFDATTAGGSNDICFDRMQEIYATMTSLAQQSNFVAIQKGLNLCSAPTSMAEVTNVIMPYITNAFGYMAMSSYPFPSNYLLLGGGGVLPAYPERVSCNYIINATAEPSRTPSFYNLKSALSVYYNATGAVQCFNTSSNANEETIITTYLWGYLACTTMFMPYSQNGVNDMFNVQNWNTTAQIEACQEEYGTTPQPDWVKINYGGRGVATWGSNIFFSNGELDPWRPGGILNATSPAVMTALIPESGHHIDLMFSNPADTSAIKAVRETEVNFILGVVGPQP